MFDFHADLAGQPACPRDGPLPSALASGFVDGCTAWFAAGARDQDQKAGNQKKKAGNQKKNEARRCYMKHASGGASLQLPSALQLEPDFGALPHASWIGLEVSFTLKTPWYSKDDRPFHVLDNPVRKDRVFGVPLMPASAWKGLVRWACRMSDGLFDHLERTGMKIAGWRDPEWIVRLFGNEKGEDKNFRAGAVFFYPTWFARVGFEIINPHSRRTRAGTQPIYYEVVPVGTPGVLRILHVPLDEDARKHALEDRRRLVRALRPLLEDYGISAKRTAGWGTARVSNWKAIQGTQTADSDDVAAFCETLAAFAPRKDGA